MLVHVRTDECNERVSRRLQFKPGIGASGQSLTAYLLQVTVDRLNRMTIRAHFDGIHQPGVRTHGRPAHRDQAYPRLRQNAGRISRTIGGANNYSPLRPTAAPRRAVQTHPQSPPARGGSGGWAASERAYERLPQAADEMQIPSKELLPFGSAASVGRATGRLPPAPGARPAVNKRRRGKAIDEEPVACGDAPPTFAGIQVIPSAS